MNIFVSTEVLLFCLLWCNQELEVTFRFLAMTPDSAEPLQPTHISDGQPGRRLHTTSSAANICGYSAYHLCTPDVSGSLPARDIRKSPVPCINGADSASWATWLFTLMWVTISGSGGNPKMPNLGILNNRIWKVVLSQWCCENTICTRNKFINNLDFNAAFLTDWKR